MGELPGVEGVVGVGVDEGGEEDPFAYLGAVDARGGREGYAGGGVDGVGGDVVCAGAEDVDEFCARGREGVSGLCEKGRRGDWGD